ncbi:MAG: hypothetical protein WCW68_00895 [Methanothrix sp.]
MPEGLGSRPDDAMQAPCGILQLPGLRSLKSTGGIRLTPPGVRLFAGLLP